MAIASSTCAFIRLSTAALLQPFYRAADQKKPPCKGKEVYKYAMAKYPTADFPY
jgi:hypothetical protein